MAHSECAVAVQGAESKAALAVPVGPPDRKNLERVIDKLQKKDPHKIFSKPVTEEEVRLIPGQGDRNSLQPCCLSLPCSKWAASCGVCRRQGTPQS